MQKLSQLQAQALISKAWSNVEKYRLGGYRFGQSLFNLLPEDIYREFAGKPHDFYYTLDSEEVTKMFYEHYVEL